MGLAVSYKEVLGTSHSLGTKGPHVGTETRRSKILYLSALCFEVHTLELSRTQPHGLRNAKLADGYETNARVLFRVSLRCSLLISVLEV